MKDLQERRDEHGNSKNNRSTGIRGIIPEIKNSHRKKGMKQKDFLIQIIEEALEKAEAEWQNKDSTEEAEPATGESEIEETQPEEENDLEEEGEPGEGNQPEEECEPEEETEPEEENELGEESKPDEETQAEEPTEW